ncbi:MAG: beta-galactosidase [Nitrososphaera sp.]
MSYILCVFVAFLPAEIEAGAGVEKHRYKAGLYLRLPKQAREWNPDYFFRHPLIDAVITTFKWSKIEPKPGKYNFSDIDAVLDLAAKYKKGIILGFMTYDQDPRDPATPDWLYDRGITNIGFRGGGVSKGTPISVPKTWDDAYLRAYGEFVRKIGQRYDNNPLIWYIAPAFGHLGNLTAQPSKGGSRAFLAEGWTADIWKTFCLQVVESYQKAFPNTPLLAKSAPRLLRDRRRDHYSKESDEILIDVAKRRVSVVTGGLEPELSALNKNNVVSRLARLSTLALSGEIRVGISDDWPLWVPEKRRQKQIMLADRDEMGLKQELRYAFGGVEGLDKTNISIIFVLHPEIDASHPENGAAQNKEVYRLLDAARKRLKEEDPIAKL